MQKHWRNCFVTKTSQHHLSWPLPERERINWQHTIHPNTALDPVFTFQFVTQDVHSSPRGEMSRGHRDGEDWGLRLCFPSPAPARGRLWLVQTDHVTWVLACDWLPASSVCAGRGHSAHVTQSPRPALARVSWAARCWADQGWQHAVCFRASDWSGMCRTGLWLADVDPGATGPEVETRKLECCKMLRTDHNEEL